MPCTQCSRQKAWVTEVENTMKETLKFVDKLQVDLDEANATEATLEGWAKTAKD